MIQTFCSHTTLVDIEKLVPNPKNPNKHSEKQIALLAKIIKAQGWRSPIVVSKRSGFIVKGHARLEAARLLKLESVPVDYQDYENEATEYADLLADNRIAELAEPDNDEIAALIKELDGKIDLDLTGFDSDALEEILKKFENVSNEESIPELPKEAITQSGDLFILGNHRLLCGDSTKIEDVKRLMNGEKAILFATDPPYLVDYNGNNRPQKMGKDGGKDWSETYGVTWDEADSKANNDLYDRFIGVAIEHAILPNAAWYMWHASKRQKMVEESWEKHGAFVHQQIVWVKSRPLIARTWYMWRHEPCFFGWIKGNKPPRVQDLFEHSVWELEGIKQSERPDHPTPKPLECFLIPMQQHTKIGELCYEPFCGSGTQLIAAENVQRKCYAMEISPVYCDVIIKRWLNLGGEKKVLCERNSETEDVTDAYENIGSGTSAT